MNNNTTRFLEIQGYIIYSNRMNDADELIIRVGRPCNGDICPYCRSKKHHLHNKGSWQIKKHSNFQEKQIYIEIKRKRFKCLSCSRTFSQDLPGIPKYARKTINFETQSLNYLSKNSFKEVGLVNKTCYPSLKNQLYKYVNPYKLLDKKIKELLKQDKIFLGIDGQSFRGQDMVLTITEVFRKEIITVLPSELQKDLEKFLKQLPKLLRLKVAGIAMDMTNKHIKLLKKYYPNALIVIDHYHLVQHAIRLMQKTRTNIQRTSGITIPIKKEMDKNCTDLTDKEEQKLLKYFIQYPKLREVYLVKERIRSLYKTSKYEKAIYKFKILKNDLLNCENLYMQELGNTLVNWEKEILNYFLCRITNAFTEGIHTKCKLIKRKSFGFRNVETYVRKLILGLFPLIFVLSSHTY